MSQEDDDLEMRNLVGILKKRRSLVQTLVDAAELVCAKMEHPTASVTFLDQERLRKAINDVKDTRILGS